ncbi:MAG: hypothetical protein B9S32_03780 [Verrucomicrobia bacterium Tous-C9LFEB]|nr:MAG: hypothetical protein B9S32_03780 [Verrucomicrobia bacterium Tous-C9LFEB]
MRKHFAVWSHSAEYAEIPLNIRSVGRYVVNPGWHEKPKCKWFVQLFWTVEGKGEFHADGTRFVSAPGDVFIYRPGDLHDIRPLTASWVYCWITWNHPKAGEWIEAFGLTGRIHHREACPQWLFEEVAEGLEEGVPEGQRRSAHLSHAILLEALIPRGCGPRKSALAERVRKHLDAHFQEVELTMQSLADGLQIHRTTLLRTFQIAYGISPSHYLHNRRMENALALLHRSSLPIKEVALRAGFSDANYFSRAVRKATGMSPREFQMGDS